jgi:NO-binding membrane sensor protein with MHYT domain
MLTVHNFSYGLVTPVLAYLMSCLGAFLGLRCTTRAMAAAGRVRLRWLLLAAVSIGTTGIWLMHFIAMLGYTIPNAVIHYNVAVTIISMLIAVVVVGIGLMIVGFAPQNWRNLILAGVFTGIGVAAMHYSGMEAIRLPARMSYNPIVFALSVVVAIGAALIMGVAVSGMHYTGMAAMHMYPVAHASGILMSGGGATAETFLLPLIIGISILAFILTATLALSPTDQEMREEQQLQQRIEQSLAAIRRNQGAGATPGLAVPAQPRPPASRAGQSRRPGDSADPLWPN